LIRPHEVIEDAFRFRHLLIRDAAYDRIGKELRSGLHERFADWLEGRDEEVEEIVGYHLERAHRCLAELWPHAERTQALAQRAAVRLSASGRRAYDRGDTGAALNLLERAASLVGADDPLRVSLLPSLGRVRRETGQLEEAEAILAEALTLGRQAGDRLVVADATVPLCDLRLHNGTLGRDRVVEELERAMRTFTDLDDKAGMARVLTLRGKLTFWKGEAAAAVEDLDRAARLADEAGDRAEEAESLQYVLAAMHRGPMPADEALARFDELLARARRNRRIEVAYLETRAHLEAMQTRFDVARDLVAQAMALAAEYGLLGLLDSHTRPAAGYVELLAGDAAAAESELRPACEGSEGIGELGFLSSLVPMLVDAVLRQGRDEEALQLTERWRPERLTVPEDADAHSGWRRVRAKALAHTGETGEAESLGREAVAIVARTDYLDAHATAVADLGEVLRLGGEAEGSASAIEEAIRLYERKGNVAAAGRLRALGA
jgi:tetratricopeptide (TPR) repeat protein